MFVTLAALSLAAQPAGADQCAADRTSARDRAAMAAAIRAGTRPDPALIERIEGYLEACASPGRPANDLMVSTLARIAARDLRVALSDAGIDVTIVDAWFGRQSEALRTNLRVTPEHGEAMVASLTAAGVSGPAMAANSTLLGNYIGARVLIERVRRGLPVG